MKTERFLIIQTSFIGDVILATAVVEKLHEQFPDAQIDFLLRKGNENLLNNHPLLNEIMIWDKKHRKYGNLFRLIRKIRKQPYDHVINLQRFFATGLITALSGSKHKAGYDKNPLSFTFTHIVRHEIGTGVHETSRNQQLIAYLSNQQPARPRLYPSAADFEHVAGYKSQPYICIAPTSVWFTKQLPANKWLELIEATNDQFKIYLLGGPDDAEACVSLKNNSHHKGIEILAGKLSLLQSAALIKDARMNYVNDSAPMHLTSAMNAPCRAIFCSTIPDFGFGPLSDDSAVIQTTVDLPCRPCGLHGREACPLRHFKCAGTIDMRSHAIS